MDANDSRDFLRNASGIGSSGHREASVFAQAAMMLTAKSQQQQQTPSPVSADFIRCYEREANASLAGLALSDVTVATVHTWAPFLECLLGPQHPPTGIVATITLTYGILFTTGVFGNACTMLVILRNKFMHTATNFYLFNLALADLLSLLIGRLMCVHYSRLALRN
jgi:hypothetical protein